MARLLLVVTVLVGCARSSETVQLMPDPLDGVEAERLYLHGVGVAARGDLLRGEQYIVAAIERGYPEEDALPRLLDICVRSERYAEALRHAEPFLRRHPDRWPLRYVVATVHMGLGHVERARLELERVIREAPDAAAPYFTLGTLHRDFLDDAETARRYFARYLALEPEGLHAAEVRSWMQYPEPPITRLPDHQEGSDTPASPTLPAAPAVPTEEGASEPEPPQGDVS